MPKFQQHAPDMKYIYPLRKGGYNIIIRRGDIEEQLHIGKSTPDALEIAKGVRDEVLKALGLPPVSAY